MADLKSAINISAHGMRAQAERLRVVAQNVANSDSLSTEPGGAPYQRKRIFFQNVLDKELGYEVVQVKKVDRDPAPFGMIYDPYHPAADEKGYYQTPNVSRMIETQDLSQAQRSYEANVSAIEISKSMIQRTLDLLR